MNEIKSFKLVSTVSVATGPKTSKAVQYVSTTLDRWPGWRFTATATGLEIEPPNYPEVTFVPWTQVVFVQSAKVAPPEEHAKKGSK